MPRTGMALTHQLDRDAELHRNLVPHAATIVNVSKSESIHQHIDPDLL